MLLVKADRELLGVYPDRELLLVERELLIGEGAPNRRPDSRPDGGRDAGRYPARDSARSAAGPTEQSTDCPTAKLFKEAVTTDFILDRVRDDKQVLKMVRSLTRPSVLASTTSSFPATASAA